ncbi:hypothetical protein L596_027631 [Steinernema carpocapsae]|uniref:Protein kinase domain-containing protein n=1 Tax=Steinernema carpocapsae TaxID=34508 RepID=A0A4U5LW31_STECR|nr:hypothetical protein L596_027631 [Steinernema carpocapsae]
MVMILPPIGVVILEFLCFGLFCLPFVGSFSDVAHKSSRPRQCVQEECSRFHATYLLFLSKQTSGQNFLKAKFLLLSQIEDCFNQDSSFHIRVLVGSNKGFSCCSYITCTQLVMQMGGEDALLDAVPENQIDAVDHHKMFENVEKVLARKKNHRKISWSENVYLISDYAVTRFKDDEERLLKLLNTTEERRIRFYPLIITTNHLKIEDVEQFYGTLNPVEVVDFDQFFNSVNLVKGVCDAGLPKDESALLVLEKTCATSKNSDLKKHATGGTATGTTDEIPKVAIDLRVFMAFNFSDPELEFDKVRSIFTRVLNDSSTHFESEYGNVIVSGPRFSVIATCTWKNVDKCIRSIQETAVKTVSVKSGPIFENDIDFAPDVMNYMRFQALRQQRTNRKSLVMILTDFVSNELVKNTYFFHKAISSQDVSITLAVVIPKNSKLTPKFVMNHYENITKNVFTFQNFDDFSANSGKVFSFGTDVHTLPYIPSGTTTTPSPFTQPKVETKITTEVTRDHQDNDTIILVLLHDFESIDDRGKTHMRLLEEISNCVSAKHQFSIFTPEIMESSNWCSDSDCVDKTLTSIFDKDLTQSLNFHKHENVMQDAVNASVYLLSPDIKKDSWNNPSLYVITNVVPQHFLKTYDRNYEFRKHVAQVNFHLVLIHVPIEEVRKISTMSTSNIIPIQNVSLWNENKLYCCQKEMLIQHHTTSVLSAPVKAIIIAGSILIAIMIVGLIYWIRRSNLTSRKNQLLLFPESPKNWFRKASTIYMDTESILSVEPMFEEMKRDLWEMNRSQLIVNHDRIVGQGAFGVVYRGRLVGKAPIEDIHRNSLFAQQFENCEVAVKRLLDHLENSHRERFLEEIETMKDLGYHPNLCNMLGCITATSPLCFVMQFAKYGDLFTFLSNQKLLLNTDSSECYQHSESQVCIRDLISFSWQISDGMAFLHDRSFTHRDLAARNVLVCTGRQVVISDFGLCRRKSSRSKNEQSPTRILRRKSKIPVRWTAPEALAGGSFSEYSDVWSYGVLLFEMFSMGKTPYDDIGIQVLNSHIQSGNRLHRPIFAPDDIWDLMRTCWESSPIQRPSFCRIREKLETILESLMSDYYLDLSNEAKLRRSFRAERDLPLLKVSNDFSDYLMPPKYQERHV